MIVEVTEIVHCTYPNLFNKARLFYCINLILNNVICIYIL